MSTPFAREPLKEFLDRKQERKKESNEDIIFSVILTVFVISTLLVYQPEITGRVVYEENISYIDISQIFNESTTLSFEIHGNVTSIRLTGSFIGNGTGRILLDNLIVVDKSQLSKPSENLITGFVVSNPVYKDINPDNSTNRSEAVENITYDLNESVNISNLSEDITLDLNESINITNTTEIVENISINRTIENITNLTEIQNITLNVTEIIEENQTIIDYNLLIEFDNYCLETCSINIYDEIVLYIELDNVVLNLSTLDYTYIDIIEQDIEDTTQNITEPTENTTDVVEIVIPDSALGINVSLTNITANDSITDEVNLSGFEVILVPREFNQFVLDNGFVITDFDDLSVKYKVNLTKNSNYVNLELNDINDIKLDFITLNDTRLSSDIFILESSIRKAEIGIQAENADTIIVCKQYENNTCKKWQETDISFEIIDDNIVFNVSEQGVYTVVDTFKTTKGYTPVNSVYLNSDCLGCKEVSNCNPKGFCPANDQGGRHYTFNAQLDFDIFDIEDNIEYAEVCAYSFLSASEDSVANYLKDSDISYCGDITKKNTISSLISYAIVSQDKGWVCIPATEILQYHLDNQYSNMFVDWLSQELGGSIGPYNCYYAMHELENCENYNPSGAEDCRPYLRVDYK